MRPSECGGVEGAGQVCGGTSLIVLPRRRFLRETLKMSNAEDLNRLTACSLVLLGHIFYVLGNHRVRHGSRPRPQGSGVQPNPHQTLTPCHPPTSPQESNNMVVPAMQLASKIPDMSVQLWSSALLRGNGSRGSGRPYWEVNWPWRWGALLVGGQAP